ncbi:tRNA pseudouridine(55) synthase TruB [Clostridium sp. C105KSO13]|uniref:tRNA pseudouridine(55) synthase TruB n=1 Tax=Clostridium sp. C105KSO13 TaxID=1776045 RepID=UPI0007406C05|nr:tRNA pseudouridine(55) synthase TruB [Clostridium sp. C105KSO13]CUX42602.1 tRNA pseudouridine synthase B [Clostridium sp. C105KSO13]
MLNGIINVYKEKGYTSHDVVAKLRVILGQKKIGHTGTLDPDAEGVLPVCLGRGTRLCDMLTDNNKTYDAVLLLGKTTDTQDITGHVLEERDTSFLTESQIKECIQGYIGEYEQLPPMYSALKVNGRKLYELAREGIEVERKKRKVQIFDIITSKIEIPRIPMEVTCSKGTYIRTLCHDIGQELGTGGCMETLLRTRVGRFEIENSLKLGQIEDLKKRGRLSEVIIPMDAMFSELPALKVADRYWNFACNGNPLKPEYMTKERTASEGERVRVYSEEEKFIGIYYYSILSKEYRLEKMFLSPS